MLQRLCSHTKDQPPKRTSATLAALFTADEVPDPRNVCRLVVGSPFDLRELSLNVGILDFCTFDIRKNLFGLFELAL